MRQLKVIGLGNRAVLEIFYQLLLDGIDLVSAVHSILQHKPEIVHLRQLKADPEQRSFRVFPLTARQVIFQY
ncbi:hypothetical protein D3C73_1567520 [compost metagenome]